MTPQGGAQGFDRHFRSLGAIAKTMVVEPPKARFHSKSRRVFCPILTHTDRKGYELVGDPGIEPGVRLREGVTVPCHTLRPVAHCPGIGPGVTGDYSGGSSPSTMKSGGRKTACIPCAMRAIPRDMTKGQIMAKKPAWVVDKEQARKAVVSQTHWLFGLHAVRDALMNPARHRLRLIVTPNAGEKLKDAIAASGMAPEVADPRRFTAPLDPQSVHQGAALEVRALDWGPLEAVALGDGTHAPRLLLLDRVSDPHNVGAILRSAEVFGARAVVAPVHHAAPETGALAKTASGALERQPYVRVRNLADAMEQLRGMGYLLLGLDGEADQSIESAMIGKRDRAVALVLGAEGPGLRQRTRETCDALVRIDAAAGFGSLNVSNAAAVALYAAREAG